MKRAVVKRAVVRRAGSGLVEPRRRERRRHVQDAHLRCGEPREAVLRQQSVGGDAHRGPCDEGSEDVTQRHVERRARRHRHAVVAGHGERVTPPAQVLGQGGVATEHGLRRSGGTAREEHVGVWPWGGRGRDGPVMTGHGVAIDLESCQIAGPVGCLPDHDGVRRAQLARHRCAAGVGQHRGTGHDHATRTQHREHCGGKRRAAGSPHEHRGAGGDPGAGEPAGQRAGA